MHHNHRSLRALLCIVPFALLAAFLMRPAGMPATAAARPTPLPRPTAKPRTTPQARPTAKPRPTPIATPITVAAPSAALATCASDIFGLSLSYTKSGGLTSTIARTFNIPTQYKGTVNATINSGSTAIYGLTSNNGVQLLTYGSGHGNGDDSVSVDDASLCYLQFTKTDALPTDANSALALLKQTFPGMPQDETYTTKTVTGGYMFILATTRPAKGGVVNAQAVSLSVVGSSKKGQIVLSATSGVGTFASSVPTK